MYHMGLFQFPRPHRSLYCIGDGLPTLQFYILFSAMHYIGQTKSLCDILQATKVNVFPSSTKC